MRVTEGMRYAQVLSRLGSLSSEYQKASNAVTTGSRLENPSSDPSAYAYALRQRAQGSQASDARSALNVALGDAQSTESTLASAGEVFQRARDLAMQGSNGSLSAADRQALAREVSGLRDQLTQLANTKGTRGYLFAGARTTTVPFDAAGTFAGDDNLARTDLGSLGAVTVGVSGSASFTAAGGGRNVFGDLAALETALNNNDVNAVSATLDNLDASRAQLVDARSRAGLVIERLSSSDALLEQIGLDTERNVEQVAGIQPYEAYSRFVTLGQSLERAVAVSREILSLGSLSRF